VTDTTPRAESLVELAARKQLPRHQYMDRATMRWIAANRPDLREFPLAPLPEATQQLLHRAAVPAEWWLESRVADSLHGVRHSLRTAALAALLARAAGLDATDTSDLVVAAAVHDCRRVHDQDDRGHGARAAAWLVQNADMAWRHFGLVPAGARTHRAAVAVGLHDEPYSSFTEDEHATYDQARQLCDLVKAADALDRYRLPKLNWWPDAAHVRVSAFGRFRATAFDLVLRSENAHLDGRGSAEAVHEALRQKGLLS
jgi:hypothetical protein